MKDTEDGEGEKNSSGRLVIGPVVGAVLGAILSFLVAELIYAPFGPLASDYYCLCVIAGMSAGAIIGMLVEKIVEIVKNKK